MRKTTRNKNYKRKTLRGGSKKYKDGNITNLNEKFNGMNFFRKYGGSTTEHEIYEILKQNPHPNIVSVYRITNSYIDIEEVNPANSIKYDKEKLMSAALSAKMHLQSLGIMYIDWKPDNMGIDADGTYKLYDFDGSGVVSSSNTTKWRLKPSAYWSYRQALANGLKDPKEIDDFAFEINFIRKNYEPLNDSEF